eukprot:scaffold38578_cov22-Cyclotella_meneghiniana.AAC.1
MRRLPACRLRLSRRLASPGQEYQLLTVCYLKKEEEELSYSVDLLAVDVGIPVRALVKPNVPEGRKTILGSQGCVKTKIWVGHLLNLSHRLPEIPRASDIKNFESAEKILLEKSI